MNKYIFSIFIFILSTTALCANFAPEQEQNYINLFSPQSRVRKYCENAENRRQRENARKLNEALAELKWLVDNNASANMVREKKYQIRHIFFDILQNMPLTPEQEILENDFFLPPVFTQICKKYDSQ